MHRFAKMLFASVAFCIASPTTVLGGQFEDGLSAEQHSDYKTALSIWLTLAKHGSREAEYALGRMYMVGAGVQRDCPTAVDWYNKAASHGQAAAEYDLTRIYWVGDECVKKNKSKAVHLLRDSAERGYGFSLFTLGSLYFSGEAADVGVPQDYAQAYFWLTLAMARMPREISDRQRANLADRRSAIASKMTNIEIAKMERLARIWIASHTNGDSVTHDRGH